MKDQQNPTFKQFLDMGYRHLGDVPLQEAEDMLSRYRGKNPMCGIQKGPPRDGKPDRVGIYAIALD